MQCSCCSTIKSDVLLCSSCSFWLLASVSHFFRHPPSHMMKPDLTPFTQYWKNAQLLPLEHLKYQCIRYFKCSSGSDCAFFSVLGKWCQVVFHHVRWRVPEKVQFCIILCMKSMLCFILSFILDSLTLTSIQPASKWMCYDLGLTPSQIPTYNGQCMSAYVCVYFRMASAPLRAPFSNHGRAFVQIRSCTS